MVVWVSPIPHQNLHLIHQSIVEIDEYGPFWNAWHDESIKTASNYAAMLKKTVLTKFRKSKFWWKNRFDWTILHSFSRWIRISQRNRPEYGSRGRKIDFWPDSSKNYENWWSRHSFLWRIRIRAQNWKIMD